MSALLFGVLAVGATARLTRLITDDYVTGWLRAKVVDRWGEDSSPAYFVRCSWCVSMYLALLVAALGVWPGHHGTAIWWWFPAAVLTASYATGAMSALTED